MQGKTPPVEIEAEQEVLGRMLQEEGGTEAIEIARTILKPSDFYPEYHKRIYEVILELHDTGSPASDLLAQPYQKKVYEEFNLIMDLKPSVYIDELKESAPSAANAEYYANKVKEASRLRQIVRITSSVSARAYEPDVESAVLVGELQEAISKDQIIASVAGKVPTARDDWPDVFSKLCTSQGTEFLGLRTGFHELDKATLGLRGLSVLGGIPGQGKSSLCLQLATEIAEINGTPTLFYSLEMSKFDLYIKVISRLSRLDYVSLTIGSLMNGRRGQGLSEEDTSKLSEGTAKFMAFADKVKIIDRAVCRDISLPVVRLHIQQAKREFDTDDVFVVIDHLQIFPCDKPGLDDMKSRLDYLVSEFKAINEQLNATILLVSEKNRGSYEKEWLGAFMGSAGIEYGVDLAMLLYEKGEENQVTTSSDDNERKIQLKIAKNRFGKKASIKLVFKPDTSSFFPD